MSLTYLIVLLLVPGTLAKREVADFATAVSVLGVEEEPSAAIHSRSLDRHHMQEMSDATDEAGKVQILQSDMANSTGEGGEFTRIWQIPRKKRETPASAKLQRPVSHEKLMKEEKLISDELVKNSAVSSGTLLVSNPSSIQAEQTYGTVPSAIETGRTFVKRADLRDLDFQLASFVLQALLCLAFLWWCKKVKLHRRYRELIPCVAKLLFRIGVDKYEEFEFKMVLHEVSYSEQLQTYLMVQAGHREEFSDASKMGPSTFHKGSIAAGFHTAICIVVPQGCTDIKFKLLHKDRKTILAEGLTSVEKIISLEDDNLVITMMRKGKGKKSLYDDPRCMVSCYCDENSDSDTGKGSDAEQGPTPEKLLLRGLDASVFSLELMLEIEKNSRHRAKEYSLKGSDISNKEICQHQLEVLAKTCQGKLLSASCFLRTLKQYYFCIYQDGSAGSFVTGWKFGCWDRADRPIDPANTTPQQEIPILCIGKIFPDANKEDEFSLEYVANSKDTESKTLHLIRVDRSRDIWVECLSVFINHLRKVRLVCKELEDASNARKSKNISKSTKKRAESRQSTFKPSNL